MSRFSNSYGRNKVKEEIVRAFNAKHTISLVQNYIARKIIEDEVREHIGTF